MQPAHETSVLANFHDATLAQRDGTVLARFHRENERFVVTTRGADGTLQDYDIKYTFGVAPLQQYLIDIGRGRLQAFGVAWDSRPTEAGGQRWFELYPDQDLRPGNPLHWTGIDQNWNHMCAECHSTNLHKNYRPDDDRFETSWSEINVGCEACHGAGSAHVEWARQGKTGRQIAGEQSRLPVRFTDRHDAAWTMNPATGIAKRTGPAPNRVETETCGLCHARRGAEHEGHTPGRPLEDTHHPSLLEAGLYFPDGQIRDEVYEYGSFRQSRMYQAGVTCSDCHDPHSGRRRAEGNELCASCHESRRFDTAAHHHHPPDSSGSRCIACHMPARTYMQIDQRRDHSFRIPRPDLSSELTAPNTCNDCHVDQDAAWASEAIRSWNGSKPLKPHFGQTLQKIRSLQPAARSSVEIDLANQDLPAIVRATLVSEVAASGIVDPLAPLTAAAKADDPQVRRAAAEAADVLDVGERLTVLSTLLHDPVRGVRLAAARTLAAVPAAKLGSQAVARDHALEEFRAAQRINADRPENQLNLGNLSAELGNHADAEKYYRAALQRDPTFVPAYANLADLLRESDRDADAAKLLRQGIEKAPRAAVLHHALGLWFVRQDDLTSGLAELRRAAELEPDDSRFSYVYAVALDSAGRSADALAEVAEALRRQPYDPALNQLRAQIQSRSVTP